MPLAKPDLEALPDCSAHHDYQQLFDTEVAGCQSRDQATLLLAKLGHKKADNEVLQQQGIPQP